MEIPNVSEDKEFKLLHDKEELLVSVGKDYAFSVRLSSMKYLMPIENAPHILRTIVLTEFHSLCACTKKEKHELGIAQILVSDARILTRGAKPCMNLAHGGACV